MEAINIDTQRRSNDWPPGRFSLPLAAAGSKTPGYPLSPFPAVSFRAWRGLWFPVTGKTPGDAQSSDAVVELGNPVSTSSNLVPGVYRQSIGMDRVRDFKKTVYAAAQTATVAFWPTSEMPGPCH